MTITLNEQAKKVQEVSFRQVAIPYDTDEGNLLAWYDFPRIHLEDGDSAVLSITVQSKNGKLYLS